MHTSSAVHIHVSFWMAIFIQKSKDVRVYDLESSTFLDFDCRGSSLSRIRYLGQGHEALILPRRIQEVQPLLAVVALVAGVGVGRCHREQCGPESVPVQLCGGRLLHY